MDDTCLLGVALESLCMRFPVNLPCLRSGLHDGLGEYNGAGDEPNQPLRPTPNERTARRGVHVRAFRSLEPEYATGSQHRSQTVVVR
mgnify:CR=1 FL=1